MRLPNSDTKMILAMKNGRLLFSVNSRGNSTSVPVRKGFLVILDLILCAPGYCTPNMMEVLLYHVYGDLCVFLPDGSTRTEPLILGHMAFTRYALEKNAQGVEIPPPIVVPSPYPIVMDTFTAMRGRKVRISRVAVNMFTLTTGEMVQHTNTWDVVFEKGWEKTAYDYSVPEGQQLVCTFRRAPGWAFYSDIDYWNILRFRIKL